MKKFGVILLVALTGCVTINDSGDGDGGGNGSKGASGVVAKKKAIDFTPAEKDTFCEWVSQTADEKAGVYTCEGGDVTIGKYTTAECEVQLSQNKGCDATALEKCFTALFDNPCVLAANELPAACKGLEACATSDSSNNGVSTNNGQSVNNGVTPNNGSSMEFCYEHTVNDVTTGKKCFDTHGAYCDSLCAETNFLSEDACDAECP